jgi:serine/threonine protein kinase
MVDMIGREFQGYRILETLGSNGGCQTFKATAPGGQDFVVLKIFPSEIGSNPGLIEKLRASFDSIERIHHPSILPLVGFGIFEGYPYTVMPYMDTGSLQDRIELGALSAINARAVIKEIALALEVVHSHGLVHGDMRPSNILFDENGSVRLMGLGEAPLLSVPSYREAYEEDGSDIYQAPEVKAMGEASALSDQYSLALISLQLLARLPVYEALDRLEHHLEYGRQNGIRSNQSAIDIPSQVANVLERALSVRPADRYPSVKAMLLSLEAAFRDEKAPSQLRPAPQKAAPEKRHRNPLIIFGSAFAIGLCLLVISPVLSSQGNNTFGNFLSFIGMSKTNESAEDHSIQGLAAQLKRIFAPAPEEPMSGWGDSEIQVGNVLPTEVALENNSQTSTLQSPRPSATQIGPLPGNTATQLPLATPTPTFTPMPTHTVTPASTVTPLPTYTLLPPAASPTPSQQWCSSDRNSEHYCTPTPTPTSSDQWCSRDRNSENYCTPTPTPTSSHQWCSRDRNSDHYCTPTPTPTSSHQWCSRDPESEHYCTPTPEH